MSADLFAYRKYLLTESVNGTVSEWMVGNPEVVPKLLFTALPPKWVDKGKLPIFRRTRS